MSAAVPEIFGRYRIVKKLGDGGMGSVYLAEDTQMRRRVALKIPHFQPNESPAVLERFYREARVAAEIRHAGICKVYDIGCIDGIHFLTMEYLDGTLLSSMIRPGDNWPPNNAIALMVQVAEALQALHACGIVHRDLKPANIMLQANGTPVLLDFGLARPLAGGSQQLTTQGQLLGTPAYMAPEQVRGHADAIGPWSDIYALGLILFELLTGRLPFRPASMMELFALVLHAERPPASEFAPQISGDLDQLCLDMLAIEITKRPANIAQLLARLQQCQGISRSENKERVGTQCPACGKRVRITEKMARKKVLCPRCHALIPLLQVMQRSATVEVFSVPAAKTELQPPPLRLGLDRTHTQLPPQRRQTWLAGLVALGLVAVVGAVWFAARDPATDTTALHAPVTGTQSTGGAVQSRTVTNSMGMQLVLIPAGTFTMGSPPQESERIKDEGPQHEVEITQPFYLGKYEVTQEEYETVMQTNPSSFSKTGKSSAKVKGLNTQRFPVERVSWEEAVRFCETLSNLPAEKANKRVYSLPTEAEWEYACRGGATTYQIFHFGDKLSPQEATFNGTYPYGGAAKGAYLERTTEVGHYKPNGFGLYDMHGNVWEWCQDRYEATYYQTCLDQKTRQNPPGPQDIQIDPRVLRGGSWHSTGKGCRSAFRDEGTPTSRYPNVGFRVCMRTR